MQHEMSALKHYIFFCCYLSHIFTFQMMVGASAKMAARVPNRTDSVIRASVRPAGKDSLAQWVTFELFFHDLSFGELNPFSFVLIYILIKENLF